MLFSQYNNLNKHQNELDFVDINLNRNNKLFIDPRLIGLQEEFLNYSIKISIFWKKIIEIIKNNNLRDLTKMFSGFKEPKETKLGYGSDSYGNSIANILKSKLIKSFIENKAIKTGILNDFSDINFFVKDISSDRISDITTKLIKDDLISFTQNQCFIHNIPMFMSFQDDIFDNAFHSEYIPSTTIKQIGILISEPDKALTLRMLNILSILKNGETLSNLKKDEMGAKLHPK